MDPFVIAIILYMAALALAFIDIFIPSGGMLIILSVVAAFAAILFGFQSSMSGGMTMLTLVAATVPAFAYVAIKIWPHTPIGKRMILHPPRQAAESKQDETSPQHELVGTVVLIESALMPSGQVKIGHRRWNAVMENGVAEAGQVVKVVGIRERNLIVRLSNEPLTALRPKKIALEEESPTAASLLELPADQLGLDSIEDA